MLSRFHTIPACHGQTDRLTDRIAISISRVSVLTRDINFIFTGVGISRNFQLFLLAEYFVQQTIFRRNYDFVRKKTRLCMWQGLHP